MQTSNGKWKSVLLVCGFLAAVVFVSFLPPSDKQIMHTEGRFHYWGHLVVFGALGFLSARAVKSPWTRVAVCLAGILFGFGMEVGEHFVFRSHMEWKDVFVDSMGVFAGSLFAIALDSVIRRRALQ